MTRESDKASKLGMIAAGVGFVVMTIAGCVNLNNPDNKGTIKYSAAQRDVTFYSMVGGGALVVGGQAMLCYSLTKGLGTQRK